MAIIGNALRLDGENTEGKMFDNIMKMSGETEEFEFEDDGGYSYSAETGNIRLEFERFDKGWALNIYFLLN